MDYKLLYASANNVIKFINNNTLEYVSTEILTSIKSQMLFICDNAANGVNPSEVLPPETKFTYAIIASRELSSPSELVLKGLIDEVTKLLINR
ncbi:hypothetical protein [Rheinheimera salexigens]|uniref:Uncharacterized protein n=1 Tax=Rheinheimera salexigens TaxID=1628148 RepID=A0A1E7Q5I5_9GAMM|nr:hypothetical protein [Rheinheimera salexigens]OEY69406.1 hypothetical protein BI198_07385 [Rheinheimera salexigens]